MVRKAACNMYICNTNKTGIQCVCWFYSQGIITVNVSIQSMRKERPPKGSRVCILLEALQQSAVLLNPVSRPSIKPFQKALNFFSLHRILKVLSFF